MPKKDPIDIKKDPIDIWCKCFFGYVNKDDRRICAFDELSFHCCENCPYFLTKKEANDICKEYLGGY